MDDISRKLTDAKVRNAKPKPAAYKLTDGGGLYLLVQPSGAKLWRYKFRVLGTEGKFAVGGYPDVSLSAAREIHREARAAVAAGRNPVHERQADRATATKQAAQAKAGSFLAVCNSWRAATDGALALNTIKQRAREIDGKLTPAFGAKPIHAVTRADIAAMLKRVETKTPEVARNLRNYLYGIMEHAIGLGLIEANPVPPARIMKRRKPTNHAAMDLDRLPEFIERIRTGALNPETRIAFLLVILTACRKVEVCGARWSEFDLDAGEWTIPAERMKMRKEHYVPLSRQAVELLRELQGISSGELLFPNRRDHAKPMSDRTLNAVMERNGFDETVHGFRSAFSTYWNSQSDVKVDVIEACLAHAPVDKIRAAYNRAVYKAERRDLLQRWADMLDAPAVSLAA